MADAIVIGAGIVGSACAWELARAGLAVTVFDPAEPGSQSSRAALGLLSFHARPENPAALFRLASASRPFYPSILEELSEITGEHIPYGQSGNLSLALHEADEQELLEAEALNDQHGFAYQRVDPVGCRELEPSLHPAVRGGLFFPEDRWVENRSLTQAIVQAARAAGAAFLPAAVETVEARGGRVEAVRAAGETHPAGWVVLAAGCWSGALPGVPRRTIEPRRGQAFAIAGQLVRRVVSTRRVYLMPRPTGEILVGATVERTGFEVANTVAGLQEVMEAGRELLPSLPSQRFLRAWAGLRPGTADGLPAIGPFEARPNLIAATGHFRDGILLAPLTARIVKQIVLGESPGLDLRPFSPDRAALLPHSDPAAESPPQPANSASVS